MLEEILDKLVDAKTEYKEYKNIADSMDNEEIKGMFNKIADDEHDHYRMIKEYIANYIMKNE